MNKDQGSARQEEPRIDKNAVSVVSLSDASGDREYWHSRSPQERLQHVEFLRRLNYGSKATGRLQRVIEVAEF
ncbi:MAG: hypothetical protein QF473_10145 [Planctomycetota bacterium]|jgi:hypothetical protein|nr:hypothetical protein [Planctomycetota bacterium]